MKKLIASCTLALCCTAWAAEPAKAAAPAPAAADAKPADAAATPMPQWKPRHVTKKDTKGIEALYKASEDAMKKGDLEAMAALNDYPMWMGTDNAAGVPSYSEMNKEAWMASMKPAMENAPKDMKMTSKIKATTFITDSLAFVEHTSTMQMGKMKDSWVSASLVVLKDGKWMFKQMVEGGWGDVMSSAKKVEAPAPAAAPKKAEAMAAPAAAPAKTTAAK